MKRFIYALLILPAIFLLTGCSEDNASNDWPDSAKQKAPSGLSEFEEVNGIGPVKAKLDIPVEFNTVKATEGEKIFDQKCYACHRLDERLVGPPLRKVTEKRSNEFIVNMILNPDEMQKKHPEVKKLLAEYMTQMPFQDVTMEETLLILEYLRSVAAKQPTASK